MSLGGITAAFAGLCCAVLALALLAAPAAAEPPAQFTLAAQWLPQAQFAGYYAAREQGFYRRRGLDVTIVHGGPNRPSSAMLELGAADAASLWLSNAIQMRARGVPLVNVGQAVQRSALLLVAKKTSGIREPRDMEGKKVGVWEGDFTLQPGAFFRRYGVNVHVVPLASSINLFLRDGVHVASAMWYNEYHTILNSGLEPDELVTFFFHDHGLNFPEDGLYCLEDTLAARRGACEAFVEASWEGWRHAFAHPEETVELVLREMRQARVATNRAHQRWMLARMRDIIQPSGAAQPLGALSAADYERVAQTLLEKRLIASVPAFDAFHRPPPAR